MKMQLRVLGKNHEFRTMKAGGRASCPYCLKKVLPGSQIYGHYGIRWGHRDCIAAAVANKELRKSPANWSKRPKHLAELCREQQEAGERVATKAKAKRKPEPSAPPSPPSPCQHRRPVFIDTLEMPESMRPTKAVEKEATPSVSRRIIFDTWHDLVKERVIQMQRTELEFPQCPVHGPMEFIEQPGGWRERWLMRLWWCCKRGD